MNKYTFLSIEYDLLDAIWFSEKGVNPRNVIQDSIPNKKCRVLDMCCGTLTNGISIAKANDNNRIFAIDMSKSMLREAKRKIKKENLTNIRIKCADATNTGLADEQFDYIVLGLVLHECSSVLRENILKEAHRLLKKEGKLIVLEWEKQQQLLKRIKYAPLYILEAINCRAFKEFFYCNKDQYFRKLGFEITKLTHCNYSSVIEMKKI